MICQNFLQLGYAAEKDIMDQFVQMGRLCVVFVLRDLVSEILLQMRGQELNLICAIIVINI